jgi:hypothetical protein
MEKKVGTVHMHLTKSPTHIPGHAVDIVIKADLEVCPHLIDLGEGFVPEVLQQPRRFIHMFMVTTPVSPGFGLHRVHINTWDQVNTERHVLLHLRPDFMDEPCHVDHQVGIGGISDMGFLHGRIHIHRRRVGAAQTRCPDGDRMGGLSRRLG